MRDNSLRQLISDRVSGDIEWRNLVAGFLVAASVGFASAMTAAWWRNPTDDELAKLAEIAACSTGQPTTAVWLEVQESEGWSLFRGWKIARRLLVQIDVDRCGVGETANADTDKRKIGAFPPGERYN